MVFLGIFLDLVFFSGISGVDVGECGRSRAPIQVLTNDRESVLLSLSLSVLPPCLSLSFFPSLFLPRRSNDFESKSHPIFQGEGGEEG